MVRVQKAKVLIRLRNTQADLNSLLFAYVLPFSAVHGSILVLY